MGTATLSRGKKLAFASLLAVLSLLVLEGATRLFERVHRAATGQTNPYLDFVNPVPVFELHTVDGRPVYQRSRYQPLVVLNQQFTSTKSKDTLRVFMLGGSAASGWPHQEVPNGHTITSLLAQKLRRVLPHETIEVINAAGSTYASHRVKFVFDEIINYEPDLVLLYNGNNEFLENFVFRPRLLPVPWRYSALARTVHEAIGRLRGRPKPAVDVKNYSFADQVVNRVSYAFGQASKYRQDPAQFQELLESYRFNIRSMVRECKRRQVAVMLLNVPVNLKDWIPNVSVHRHDLKPAEREIWQTRFREGVLALEAGDPARAATALEQAVALDDEYAEAHYQLGVARQKLRQIAAAKSEYLKALERDAYPFRELPEFDRALTEIARSEGVPLIDSVAILEQRAQDGINGLDVLVDYCHLTGSSQEAVAQAVLEEMGRKGLLPAPLAVPLADTRIDVPPVFDQMATDYGLLSMYRQLLVMRQYDKLDAVYARLVEVLHESLLLKPAEADETLRQIQIVERIQQVIVPYRKLLRAEKLGTLEREFPEGEAREIFDNYVNMIRMTEAQEMPWEEFARAVPDFSYRPKSTPD